MNCGGKRLYHRGLRHTVTCSASDAAAGEPRDPRTHWQAALRFDHKHQIAKNCRVFGQLENTQIFRNVCGGNFLTSGSCCGPKQLLAGQGPAGCRELASISESFSESRLYPNQQFKSSSHTPHPFENFIIKAVSGLYRLCQTAPRFLSLVEPQQCLGFCEKTCLFVGCILPRTSGRI